MKKFLFVLAVLVLFLSVTWAWPQTSPLDVDRTKLVTDSVTVGEDPYQLIIGKYIFLWHHGGPRPEGDLEVPKTGPWYEWTSFERARKIADSTTHRPINGGRSVTVCWFSGIPVTIDTFVVEAPVQARNSNGDSLQTNKGPDSVTTWVDKDGTKYSVEWHRKLKILTPISKQVLHFRGRVPVRIEVAAYQQGSDLVVYFTPYDKDDRPVYCSGDVSIDILTIQETGDGYPVDGWTNEHVVSSDFKIRQVGILGTVKRIAIFRHSNPEGILSTSQLDSSWRGYRAIVYFSPDGLNNIIQNSQQFFWR